MPDRLTCAYDDEEAIYMNPRSIYDYLYEMPQQPNRLIRTLRRTWGYVDTMLRRDSGIIQVYLLDLTDSTNQGIMYAGRFVDSSSVESFLGRYSRMAFDPSLPIGQVYFARTMAEYMRSMVGCVIATDEIGRFWVDNCTLYLNCRKLCTSFTRNKLEMCLEGRKVEFSSIERLQNEWGLRALVAERPPLRGRRGIRMQTAPGGLKFDEVSGPAETPQAPPAPPVQGLVDSTQLNSPTPEPPDSPQMAPEEPTIKEPIPSEPPAEPDTNEPV